LTFWLSPAVALVVRKVVAVELAVTELRQELQVAEQVPSPL
jgi:hypothetical protein